MGSNYSGAAAPRQAGCGLCPLGESSAGGAAPLGVASPTLSSISQACGVEWVSGGDGQKAWQPGAVEFRGGTLHLPSHLAFPCPL